jgi:hypothetical protein
MMTTSYTDEAKFTLLDDGSKNWGAVINEMLEALDKGAELTFVYGETVVAGDVVAISLADGKLYKAESNTETLTPALGFAPNAVTVGNKGKVRWFGWIDVDTSFSYTDSVSWSPGQAAYVGSVAGRLAKTRYSWANAVGYAKSFTDDDFTTRFMIHPEMRKSELFEDVTIEKKLVFATEVNNGNSGAAKTIDWTQGNKQKIVLTANCVLSFGHPFGICTVTLKVQQDAAGSRLATWLPTVMWPGGTAPTLSTGSNDIDIIVFYYDGLNWFGSSNLDYS